MSTEQYYEGNLIYKAAGPQTPVSAPPVDPTTPPTSITFKLMDMPVDIMTEPSTTLQKGLASGEIVITLQPVK